MKHPRILIISSLLLLSFLFSCKKDDPEINRLYDEGMSLYLQNNTAGALGIFDSILKKQSDHVKARIMKGKIQYYSRDFENASGSFSRALKDDPDSIDAKFWLGKTQAMMPGREESALKELGEVLEKDSSHLEAMYYRAIILERLKKPDEAQNIYKFIIQQTSVIAMSHVHLAQILKRSGQEDAARKEFAEAKSLVENNPLLKNEIMLIELGQK
jgi:tetratricopeptide (TPR) repeat protein